MSRRNCDLLFKYEACSLLLRPSVSSSFETVARARRAKLDPFRSLQNNDAYPFFKKLRGHIVTGPTGTNVNDLYLLLAL